MRYYCGIDGGGTKTAAVLTDENGKEYAASGAGGSSWRSVGIQGTAELFAEQIRSCLTQAHISMNDLAGAAVGVPCFGENAAADKEIASLLSGLLPGIRLYLCNDAEVGWAGSLEMQPGVNVVAGTGSIAYGRNGAGESARCGGWSSYFGDEGSCYWLGRKTVELFCRQMDGRVRQRGVYEVIMERSGAAHPQEFIDRMESCALDRSKVASVQKYLLLAAEQGDSSARSLYEEAADELGMMALAAAQKIQIPGERLKVSVSGGLLHAERFFLERFQSWTDRFDGQYVPAALEPVYGAALIARSMFSDNSAG